MDDHEDEMSLYALHEKYKDLKIKVQMLLDKHEKKFWRFGAIILSIKQFIKWAF